MTHFQLTKVLKNKSQMNNGSDIIVCILFTHIFSGPFSRLSDTLFHYGEKVAEKLLINNTELTIIVGAYVPIEILMAFFKFTKVDAGLQQPWLLNPNSNPNPYFFCRKSKDSSNNSDTMTLK